MIAAEALQVLLDTPDAERPTKPAALRTWLRGVESSQRALDRIDRLLAGLGRRFAPPPAPPIPAVPQRPSFAADADTQDLAILARIPKTKRAELRITSCLYKGRRTIDVRVWAMLKGSDEFRPTRKGVQVDARNLAALTSALQLAQQHA